MQPTHKFTLPILVLSVLGVVILGGAVVYFSNKYPSAFENFFGRTSVITQGVRLVNSEQLNKDLSLKKYDVALPKSKVTAAYYVAFNDVVNEAVIMDDAFRNEMTPLFVKVKEAYDTHNLDGLGALASQIRGLNQEQKDRAVILSGYLNSLSEINKNNPGKETATLTDNFVAAGVKMVDAFSAYSSMIDTVLNGSDLSTSTVDQAKTVSENLVSAVTGFEKSLQSILSSFSQVVQAELKAKTGTATSSNTK